MKSKFILLSLLSSLLLPISASATVDYNIAKGLAPTSKDQSISVLKSFKGDFRILGHVSLASIFLIWEFPSSYIGI